MNRAVYPFLRFELLTKDNSPNILALFGFPSQPFLPAQPSRASMKYISQGQVVSRALKGGEDERGQLAALSGTYCNHVEVVRSYSLDDPTNLLRVSKIEAFLYPSANNRLWASTAEWPSTDDTPKRWQEYSKATLIERRAAFGWPTEFSMLVYFDVAAEEVESLYRRMVPLLAQSVPANIIPLCVIGSGGIAVFNSITRNITDPGMTMEGYLSTQRTIPETYKELGTKFTHVQPIMLGPAADCEAIQAVFGDAVAFYAVSGADRSHPYGLLCIPKSIMADEHKEQRVAPHLIAMH